MLDLISLRLKMSCSWSCLSLHHWCFRSGLFVFCSFWELYCESWWIYWYNLLFGIHLLLWVEAREGWLDCKSSFMDVQFPTSALRFISLLASIFFPNLISGCWVLINLLSGFMLSAFNWIHGHSHKACIISCILYIIFDWERM